jgi:hypothetical protein
MALTTDLQIANLALELLGVSQIANLASSGYTGVNQDSFDLIIGDLLERHPWRFARTYVALAASVPDNPVAQYTKAYTLPANMVGYPEAVYTTSAANARPHHDYALAEGLLYTNASSIFIEYKTEPAVASWPNAFALLAQYALAASWAMPVTEVRTKDEFYTLKAFGGAHENGVGGQMGVAIVNDMRSEPMRGMLDQSDPIADARFAHTQSTDFEYT